MNKINIFLASSNELSSDRQQFEQLINRKNNLWTSNGVFLHLRIWEDFLDAMSQTRLQDEYNKAIRQCDILVLLFFTKVGKYTREEFETAYRQFQATGKPLIYTYLKDATPDQPPSKDHTDSLQAFKDHLAGLGHFPTLYKNTDHLLHHFSQQLDKLAADGIIDLNQPAATQAPGRGKNIVGGSITNSGNIRIGDNNPASGEHYDQKNIVKGDIHNTGGDITIGDGH